MIGLTGYSTALANVDRATTTPSPSTPAQAAKTRELLRMPTAQAWGIVSDAEKARDYPSTALEAVIWSVLSESAEQLGLPAPAASEAFDPERIADSFRALVKAANPAPAQPEPVTQEPAVADLTFSIADRVAAEQLPNDALLHALRYGSSKEVANYAPQGFAAILAVALERAQRAGSGITAAEIQNEICAMVRDSSSAYNAAVLGHAAKACDPTMLFLTGLETVSPGMMENAAGAHHVLAGGMSGSEASFRHDMFQIGIRGAKLGAETLARVNKEWPKVPHLVKTLSPEAVAQATARGAQRLLERLRTERFTDGGDVGGVAAVPGAALSVLWNHAHPREAPQDERFKDYSRPDYTACLAAEQILPALTAAYANNLGGEHCPRTVRAMSHYIDAAVLETIARSTFVKALEGGDARAIYAIYEQTAAADRDSQSSAEYTFSRRVRVDDLRAKTEAAVHTMVERLASETFTDRPFGIEVNRDVGALVSFIRRSRTYRDSEHKKVDGGAFADKYRAACKALHERSRHQAPGVARYLEEYARFT